MVLGNDAAMDARASSPGREIRVVGLDGPHPKPAPTVGDEARLRQLVVCLSVPYLDY